ncbi:MAG: hypothetical protein ACRC4L_01990 [Mycoplasma sp.]
MSNKNKNRKAEINIDAVISDIFQEIYDISHKSNKCYKCESENIVLTNESEIIYKCSNCKNSFSPRTNSLYQKIRLSNDNWIKFLRCMINDCTLEDTIKAIETNPESAKRRWKLIYENVEWKKYDIEVRSEPTKNIYADFEIVIG